MRFTLEERPGGRWRASTGAYGFAFVCPENIYSFEQSGPSGLYVERDTRGEAVVALMEAWGGAIARVAEWAAAGRHGFEAVLSNDHPSTDTPIGGYCAIEPPGSES